MVRFCDAEKSGNKFLQKINLFPYLEYPIMKEKFLVLIFTFTIFFTAFAYTLTVTSGTNSGAGTLREAITLANANGTAVTDLIQFNIADLSISGRTIAIATLLPDLISNITIDGSTQPENKIGVSDAKIRITNAAGMATYQIFSHGQSPDHLHYF